MFAGILSLSWPVSIKMVIHIYSEGVEGIMHLLTSCHWIRDAISSFQLLFPFARLQELWELRWIVHMIFWEWTRICQPKTWRKGTFLSVFLKFTFKCVVWIYWNATVQFSVNDIIVKKQHWKLLVGWRSF